MNHIKNACDYLLKSFSFRKDNVSSHVIVCGILFIFPTMKYPQTLVNT